MTERELLSPLIAYLTSSRRARFDTLIVEELPWNGRRVDLATLTASRNTTAFELKLRNNGRAIEQAAHNRLSFDRSYVVTATPPSIASLEEAHNASVGIIVVDVETMGAKVVLESPSQATSPIVRKRLLWKLRQHGSELACV